MHLLAELAVSTESLLMIGMGTLAGVVTMLYRRTERDNARQVHRADNCEAEHRKCEAQQSELRVKQAALEGDVAHLRETVAIFREQLRVPHPPATPTQPNTTHENSH